MLREDLLLFDQQMGPWAGGLSGLLLILAPMRFPFLVPFPVERRENWAIAKIELDSD